jgi:hypothetical protein
MSVYCSNSRCDKFRSGENVSGDPPVVVLCELKPSSNNWDGVCSYWAANWQEPYKNEMILLNSTGK